MATNGMVSVVRDGVVVAKAVCGCNGYNAGKLAATLRERGFDSIEDIHGHAVAAKFGRADCLVVMDRDREIADDDPPPLYYQTFDDPRFNPRRADGRCEHVVVVEREG